MRDAAHYRKLLAQNPAASVGFTLAAAAVYASRFGSCEAADHTTDEWKQIARDLKTRYGENLTADEVRSEMKPRRGAPHRTGVLIRVPCRFMSREQYETIIRKLDIDQRANALLAAIVD